jgi:PilZ domain-containing protein
LWPGVVSGIAPLPQRVFPLGTSLSLDQRQYNRVRVDYEASFSGEAYRAQGIIVNLSILGCRARSAFPIKKGESIGILISVPAYDHPIYVSRAEVQWADGNEFGMEFIHMEWEGRQHLGEIIRAIEASGEGAPAQGDDVPPS